jgi:hypothetical protein
MRSFGWLRLLVVQLASAAALLVGVGLVAVGVSGAASAAMGATAGTSFVSGDAPDVHYSAARCADLREYAPSARTCADAAADHHFDEVVLYRATAGVLGAGWLCGLALVRRRRRGRPSGPSVLPDAFVPTVATTVFGGAAVFLFGQSADLVAINSGRGAGQFLSGAIVAAAVAAWFGVRLLGDLIRRARSVAEVQPA